LHVGAAAAPFVAGSPDSRRSSDPGSPWPGSLVHSLGVRFGTRLANGKCCGGCRRDPTRSFRGILDGGQVASGWPPDGRTVTARGSHQRQSGGAGRQGQVHAPARRWGGKDKTPICNGGRCAGLTSGAGRCLTSAGGRATLCRPSRCGSMRHRPHKNAVNGPSTPMRAAGTARGRGTRGGLTRGALAA
jgi:hypothetical protein